MSVASAPSVSRQGRNQLLGFNVITAVILGVIGFYIGIWIGNRIGTRLDWVSAIDQNDAALFLGYLLGSVGWLAGLGFLNYPLAKMVGRPASIPAKEGSGALRYFSASTDHKVIGLQYLFGIGLFFFFGGVEAMVIRTDLLRPSPPILSGGQYLTTVSLHGTMMVMMMSSVILGPLGHYMIPLMIGARRMAFPRLESLSFWLLVAAGFIFVSSIHYGGIPTGWTGYPSLANEANAGMDAYLVAFALIAISMVLNGINVLTTVLHMRAPGVTWARLPVFVWGLVCTSVLMTLAPMMLVAALVFEALDRTASTSFYLAPGGGSPFLYENMFWFFGHPEVYILALPGFGLVLELLPVFARKPLFGYRMAVAGMLGVTLLSFMVWQHHLFVSGINAPLRPFYMLTTELISIPTGLIFIVAMGTLWRGAIRFTVPMLFALSFFFNFLIGGLSGVYLSDVPSDVTLHGGYFVMAHFHYTIMGGLVFAFLGGVYFWLPKMTGFSLNETLSKVHFWTMFIAFNSTFFPLLIVGAMGMPRRVNTYAPHLQFLNDWVSISAFCLGASMLVFLANLIYSLGFARIPAPQNPWRSRSLEWQVATPVPEYNFAAPPVVQAGPYEYGLPGALPVLAPGAVPAAGD